MIGGTRSNGNKRSKDIDPKAAVKLLSNILCNYAILKERLYRTSKLLTYSTEAVYPFYILHQTIMMIFGYYILQMPLGIFPKFFLVVIVTFGGSFVVYEFFIKRFNVTRVLSGMKPFV